MEINYNDGSKEDSSNLNDVSAELYEASSKFFDVCLKYKIPFLLRWYNPNDETFGGASNFNKNPKDIGWVLSSIQDHFDNELKEANLEIIKRKE